MNPASRETWSYPSRPFDSPRSPALLPLSPMHGKGGDSTGLGVRQISDRQTDEERQRPPGPFLLSTQLQVCPHRFQARTRTHLPDVWGLSVSLSLCRLANTKLGKKELFKASLKPSSTPQEVHSSALPQICVSLSEFPHP